MKMVKCLPEYEYFTVFLKKKQKNIVFKIRRSKTTDYAALNKIVYFLSADHFYLRKNVYLP